MTAAIHARFELIVAYRLHPRRKELSSAPDAVKEAAGDACWEEAAARISTPLTTLAAELAEEADRAVAERSRQAAERAFSEAYRELCTRAKVTERQSVAWILERHGLSQREIGEVMGIDHKAAAARARAAHLRLQRYAPDGATNGVRMADELIADANDFRRRNGPWGRESSEAFHRGYRGKARSVRLTPWGTDADVTRAYIRQQERERGKLTGAAQTEPSDRDSGWDVSELVSKTANRGEATVDGVRPAEVRIVKTTPRPGVNAVDNGDDTNTWTRPMSRQ